MLALWLARHMKDEKEGMPEWLSRLKLEQEKNLTEDGDWLYRGRPETCQQGLSSTNVIISINLARTRPIS
jgi:hypothetical protein